MTVAALEAAPALDAAAAPAITAAPTSARAASGRAGARARRPLPPPAAAPGSRGRGRARAAGPRHATPARAREPSMRTGFDDVAPRLRKAAPTDKIHRGNYQGIILGEFVAAVLLVALVPFTGTSKNASSLSPYAGKDMLQLGGIMLAYFVLALISTAGGQAARLSAWLGGLVLLTVGLASAAHLAQVIDLAGIGSSAAQTTADIKAGQ